MRKAQMETSATQFTTKMQLIEKAIQNYLLAKCACLNNRNKLLNAHLHATADSLGQIASSKLDSTATKGQLKLKFGVFCYYLKPIITAMKTIRI